MISEQATNIVLELFKKHNVQARFPNGGLTPLAQALSIQVFEAWGTGLDDGKAFKEKEIRRALGL